MMLDDTQRAVLLFAIEDRCGLWEITRERALYEKTREEQIELASGALKSLLAQGLVKLYRRIEQDVELGFAGLERYAQERLDLSPRTARRIVALARAERRAPAVATAFRDGSLHAL